MTRLKLTIAYDGTGFRGLAPNPGIRSVVGEVQAALAPYLGAEPDLVMSGRTDAGVHSSGQVLSFDVPDTLADTDRIAKIINTRLAPEVVALVVEQASADFSARFSALGRRYRYLVLSSPQPDPFLARTSWWVPEPLDLASMRLACDPILGEHDFSSFCRRPKAAEGPEGTTVSLVRRVTSAQWSRAESRYGTGLGELFEFDISGTAFCHQMVRSLVGFHVAVGRGRRSAGELRAVMAARDRNASVSPAPPHGLNLVAVDYPDP